MSILVSTLSKRGWYSTDASILRRSIKRLLDSAPDRQLGRPRAVIVPHAGFSYCAGVTIATLKQAVAYSYSKIVILGPSHFFKLDDQICFPNVLEIQTPLGKSMMDVESLACLRHTQGAVSSAKLEEKEHSVQVEIPYLQVLFPLTPLVPIVVGALSGLESARCVTTMIRQLIDEDTLLVLSSDFTHYGAHFSYIPFTEDIPARIRVLDFEVLDVLLTPDVAGIWSCFSEKNRTVCGEPVFKVALPLLEGWHGHLITYAQSGMQTGSFEHSVSYAGVVYV